jgi:hypothetical protein
VYDPVEYPGVVPAHEHSLRIGLIACPEPPREAPVVWRTENVLCLDAAQRDVPAGCRALNASELGPVVGYRFIDEAKTVRSADGFYFCCRIPAPECDHQQQPGAKASD